MTDRAPTVVVRPAEPADAEAIAEAHVRAWQAAYPGEMPQEFLDSLDVADRAVWWRRALAEDAGEAGGAGESTTLVATVDGAVAGFVTYGAAREDEPPGTGEVWAVNVRPDRWSAGVGSALLRAAQDGLAAAGHRHAVLWVVPGNLRARRFYERHGWAADGAERTIRIRDVTVAEARYRRDLS